MKKDLLEKINHWLYREEISAKVFKELFEHFTQAKEDSLFVRNDKNKTLVMVTNQGVFLKDGKNIYYLNEQPSPSEIYKAVNKIGWEGIYSYPSDELKELNVQFIDESIDEFFAKTKTKTE